MTQQLFLECSSSYPQIPTHDRIQSWVETALDDLQNNCEISLKVVDEEEGKTLNKTYRQKDYATNVLSFPAHVPEAVELAFTPIGDIAICSDVVAREAKEQNKTFEQHFAHMLIHGLLHLLGYDHIEPEDEEIMQQLEIDILKKIGYPNPYIIEDVK